MALSPPSQKEGRNTKERTTEGYHLFEKQSLYHSAGESEDCGQTILIGWILDSIKDSNRSKRKSPCGYFKDSSKHFLFTQTLLHFHIQGHFIPTYLKNWKYSPYHEWLADWKAVLRPCIPGRWSPWCAWGLEGPSSPRRSRPPASGPSQAVGEAAWRGRTPACTARSYVLAASWNLVTGKTS